MSSDQALVAAKGGQALGAIYQEFITYETAGSHGTFQPAEAGRILFNGTSVGKTGKLQKDVGGPVRDAETVRDYSVPAKLVNWDGDNVIVIHGWHDGGSGAFKSTPLRTISCFFIPITGVMISICVSGRVPARTSSWNTR